MHPSRVTARARIAPAVVVVALLAGCSVAAEPPLDPPTPAAEAEDDGHGHVHDAPIREPELTDDPKLAALSVDDVPAIVFSSNDDGAFRLGGIEPDGSGRVTLSELAANNPSWSADGSQLSTVGRIFRDGHYEMAVLVVDDDPGVTELITGSRVPSVSSFRSNDEVYVQTAQVSSRESSGAQSVSAIESIDLDGTASLPVISDHASVYHPAWSADGVRLAYVTAQPGCEATPATPCEQPLMLWEGGRTRPIVQGGVAAHPAWSPDGRTIAFTWLVDGVRQIRTVSLEGGTSEVHEVTDAASDADEAAWSPDGGTLAFMRDCDIWLQPLGGDAVNLTDSAECEMSPAWRPASAR